MVLHKRTINIGDIDIPVIKNKRIGLLADIKENGLKKRVWLKQNNNKYFIRDGRHRVACCLELGITNIPALI